MNLMKELYNYRELLKTNIKKDIRGKYKGSWLGVVWTFLNPLLQLLVYSFVFPFILRINVENYTIFMIVALMPWNFFTTAVQQGCGCIVANEGILKKVYFPREILPVSIVTSTLVNFLITCIIMFVFIIFGGVGVTWHVVILSAIVVFVRDVDHFVGIVLMLAFYVTPIIYTPDMLPAKFQWAITFNPIAQLINAYRDILYYHQLPNMTSLGIVGLVSLAALGLGYMIFKKLERNFVEEL